MKLDIFRLELDGIDGFCYGLLTNCEVRHILIWSKHMVINMKKVTDG